MKMTTQRDILLNYARVARCLKYNTKMAASNDSSNKSMIGWLVRQRAINIENNVKVICWEAADHNDHWLCDCGSPSTSLCTIWYYWSWQRYHLWLMFVFADYIIVSIYIRHEDTLVFFLMILLPDRPNRSRITSLPSSRYKAYNNNNIIFVFISSCYMF